MGQVRVMRGVPCAGLVLALAAQAPDARAQTTDTGSVETQFTSGTSTCPEPSEVQREVLSLIPPERRELLQRGVSVVLEDLGDSYRVTASKDEKTAKKSYSDPARDCTGRAHFAAVLAVLTVMPPELDVEPSAPPPSAPAPAPLPAPAPRRALPPPAPPRAALARIELGGFYVAAPAILRAPELHSLGAELRVALGRGALSGTLSVAYESRSQFELGGVRGDVLGWPTSAGLRVRTEAGPWFVATDVGALLVVQSVRATNLLLSKEQRSLELGARVGVSLQRALTPHFAPFIAAFAWLVPSPRDLSVAPQGTIGNLPYLWLGGSAGVSFGL
ncbi:MAG TPA: hypothetical protein VIK01_07690 [Polyangiaceae bacterium]